jgi:hypothetical protein
MCLIPPIGCLFDYRRQLPHVARALATVVAVIDALLVASEDSDIPLPDDWFVRYVDNVAAGTVAATRFKAHEQRLSVLVCESVHQSMKLFCSAAE